jgi:hypothetical protein
MSGYKDKATNGPWRVSAANPMLFGADRAPGMEPIGFIYAPAGDPDSEPVRRAASDCQLCAEAGTVLHETGYTPRELAEQRDDLTRRLEEDRGVLDSIRTAMGGGPYDTLAKRIADMADQRAELLAALKAMVGCWQSVCAGQKWDPDHVTEATNATAAIAKCEGGAR